MSRLCLFIPAIAVVMLSGCASLTFTPTTATQIENDRKNAAASGYPVYPPKVLFAFSQGKEGCAITRLLVPNFDKPILVKISSGWGSSTIQFDTSEGWALAKASAAIDNTALLNKLVADKSASGATVQGGTGGVTSTCPAGLYELAGGEGSMALKRIQTPTEGVGSLPLK
jgi:hypothetical protein